MRVARRNAATSRRTAAATSAEGLLIGSFCAIWIPSTAVRQPVRARR